MYSEGAAFRFARRFGLLILGALVVVAAMNLLVFIGHEFTGIHPDEVRTLHEWIILTASFVPVFPFLGALTAAMPIIMLGGIVLVCETAIWMAHWFLIFCRALVWRIVEYNKGAWAAITLLVTVVAGFVSLYKK